MSKASSDVDSEAEDERPRDVSKIGAILCPAVCAILIVAIFACSFAAAKLLYEKYDTYCAARRYGVRYKILPNVTIKFP